MKHDAKQVLRKSINSFLAFKPERRLAAMRFIEKELAELLTDKARKTHNGIAREAWINSAEVFLYIVNFRELDEYRRYCLNCGRKEKLNARAGSCPCFIADLKKRYGDIIKD